MGKLHDAIMRQQENNEVLEIYNFLSETTGSVWSSQWQMLTTVDFDNERKIYKPSKLWHDLKKHFKGE